MKSVGFWGPDLTAVPDILLILPSQEEDLKYMAGAGAYSAVPSRVLRLAVNAIPIKDDVASLIAWQVGGHLFDACGSPLPPSSLASSLQSSWRTLSVGVSTAQLEVISGAARQLMAYEGALLKDAKAIAGLLFDYAETVMHHLSHSAPRLLDSLTAVDKPWWQSGCGLYVELASILRSIRGYSAGRAGLDVLENKIEAYMRILQAMFPGLLDPGRRRRMSAESKFFHASAWCMASASLHVHHKRSTQALLLMHRAADLYTFASCVKANQVDFDRGTRYSRTNERPTLLLSLGVLYRSAGLLRDDITHQAFEELNSVRNVIIYTHGMSGVSPDYARLSYERILAALVAVDPIGPEWKNTVSTLDPRCLIDDLLPFTFDSAWPTYVDDVTSSIVFA